MRKGRFDSASFTVCAVSGLLLPAVARADFGVPISPPAPVNSNAGFDSGNDATPALATDGQGLWIVVWQSADTLGNTIGTDLDILFARSVDSGAHWSVPAPLNTNAKNDTNGDRMPVIATDGQGHWVVVWRSDNPIDSDLLFARSIDNGVNWSSPGVLNTNFATDGDDSNPVIASDGKGVWITIWNSETNLSGTGSDGDILYARSTDNGASWSDPLPLNTTAKTDTVADFEARVATDSAGKWIVVWSTFQPGTSGKSFYARSIDNGVSWSSPALLCASGGADANEVGPTIASGGNGRWVAIWGSTDSLGNTIGGEGDILAAHSVDNGASWSSPAVVNSNAAAAGGDEDYDVDLTTDRNGNWVAVWTTEETIGDLQPQTNSLIARSIDDGVSWSISAPLNIDAPGKPGQDSSPRIATDGRGEWVGAWVGGAGVSGNDADIFAAHFGLPDCNRNLIGDPLETAAGISPDINGNRVPDVCDALGLPPARPDGCGGGPCGVGAAGFAPLTLLAATRLRRLSGRPRKEGSNV